MTDTTILSVALNPHDEKLITKAVKLLIFLDSPEGVLCNLSPAAFEKTQYSKRPEGKSVKHKGGKPPIDYTAVDMKVDLERAILNLDLRGIRRNYHTLARLINW